MFPCRGSLPPWSKSHIEGVTERLGVLSTHAFFLEIESLKASFAAVVESLGGPTGALPCLEPGDLVIHHSWWTRLLFLSGEAHAKGRPLRPARASG